jgi:hypothetical protein
MNKFAFFAQVCDIIDGLFVSIFKHLTENCKKELETINRQYPFEPLQVKHACLFMVTMHLSALCSSIDWPKLCWLCYAVSRENLEAHLWGRNSNVEGTNRHLSLDFCSIHMVSGNTFSCLCIWSQICVHLALHISTQYKCQQIRCTFSYKQQFFYILSVG